MQGIRCTNLYIYHRAIVPRKYLMGFREFHNAQVHRLISLIHPRYYLYRLKRPVMSHVRDILTLIDAR